jgi:hypothetical protein
VKYPMPTVNSRHDLPGRILAFIVFLLGVALLCIVFAVAWSLYRAPVPGLEMPVKPGASAPPAAGIGIALTAFVRQLLLLAVMTLAGSLIASKGVHLYFTATDSSSAKTSLADTSPDSSA